MSELSCDTPFIGQIGTLDLVRNRCVRSRDSACGSVGKITRETDD